MEKTGTLKELNLKPGDRVWNMRSRSSGTIDDDMIWQRDDGKGHMAVSESWHEVWQVISRAAYAAPTLWSDMTDAERDNSAVMDMLEYVDEVFDSKLASRARLELGIKPQPVRKTVKYSLFGSKLIGYVALDLVDGVPDWDSLRKWED